MAKVSGLTPFEDDRPTPAGRIEARRTQIDVDGGVDKMPRLRPTASPVDTYSRPAAELPADRQLISLADALGGLNTALQRYGSVAEQQRQKDNAAEVQRAQAVNSPEAFKNWQNDPANAPKLKGVAAQEVLGRQSAILGGQALNNEYVQTFDKETGDIDEFIRRRQAADLEGKSPDFITSYMTTMGPAIERLRVTHQQYKAGRQQETVESGLITIYQQAIESGIAEGKKPEEVMAAIRARRSSDARYNSVPGTRQDELLVESARLHAEGKGGKDFLEAFLNLPGKIVHSDGREQETSSLAARFAGKADVVRNAARQKDVERGQHQILGSVTTIREAAEKGQMTEDQVKQMEDWHGKKLIQSDTYQSILRLNRATKESAAAEAEKVRLQQGWLDHYNTERTGMTTRAADAIRTNQASSLREVILTKADAQGRPQAERVSVKDQIDAARDTEMRRIDIAETSREISPENAFNQRVTFHNNAGTTHEPWQMSLARAGSSSIRDLRERNGQPSEATLGGFELYRKLRSQSPALLDRHISKETRDLFDMVEAHTSIGENVNDAFTSAYAAMQLPAEARQSKVKDVDRAITGMRQEQWFGLFGGKSIEATGNAYVQRTVRDMAGVYAQTLPVDAALKAAAKRFNETHTIVLGSPIRTHDLNMPPWFSKEVEEYAKWYADRDKSDDVRRASDLTVSRIEGSDVFQLRNKKTGLAVGLDPANGGLPSAFTLEHLSSVKAEREARVQEQIIRDNAASSNLQGTLMNPSGVLSARMRTAPGSPERATATEAAVQQGRKNAAAAGALGEIASGAARQAIFGAPPPEDEKNLPFQERLARGLRRAGGAIPNPERGATSDK